MGLSQPSALPFGSVSEGRDAGSCLMRGTHAAIAGQNKKNDNGNAFYESLEKVFESCIMSSGMQSAALLPSSHFQTHGSQCLCFSKGSTE